MDITTSNWKLKLHPFFIALRHTLSIIYHLYVTASQKTKRKIKGKKYLKNTKKNRRYTIHFCQPNIFPVLFFFNNQPRVFNAFSIKDYLSQSKVIAFSL